MKRYVAILGVYINYLQVKQMSESKGASRGAVGMPTFALLMALPNSAGRGARRDLGAFSQKSRCFSNVLPVAPPLLRRAAAGWYH